MHARCQDGASYIIYRFAFAEKKDAMLEMRLTGRFQGEGGSDLHCHPMGGREALAFRRNLQAYFREWRTIVRRRILVLPLRTSLCGRRNIVKNC